MHQRIKRFRFILPLVGLMIACAKQGFPPGGPEDKTPPTVDRTDPAPGAVLVPAGREVRIWFSEGVKTLISNDAVFLSPNPGEGVRMAWRGRRLTIRLPRPFQDSTTFVVTLGTGIQDIPGNAMASSFTLAFTTGDSLDRGELHGRATVTGSALGMDVWAYRLDGAADPDPRAAEPDYAVQCREDGTFHFSHLSPGRYRVFGVRDRAKDRLYNPVEDEIGLPFRDADLSPENQQRDSVRFRMAREDTLGPVLVRAFAPNEREMLLQFDESVTLPPSWKNVKRFEPPDTTTLRNAFVDPADPKRICLLTETQQPKHLYAVALTGLTDMSGNPPDSSSSFVRIEGRAGSDTTVPRLSSVEPKNNNRFVNPSAAIRLVFNEPMDTSRTRSGTTLSDSSGMPVECRLEWDTPSSLTLVPRMLLASLSRYTQTVGPPACDAFGRAMQDTTIGFIVLNADTLSQVSGYALCPDDAAAGPIVVSLRQAENPSIVYNRTLAGPGPYAFGAVLPGRYILEAYRDEDGNGRYDFGRPHPFKPSERFAVYSDTIIARSRWPNEGNDLVLP